MPPSVSALLLTLLLPIAGLSASASAANPRSHDQLRRIERGTLAPVLQIATSALANIATTPGADQPLRCDAIRSLAALGGDIAEQTVEKLAEQDLSPEIIVALIQAVGSLELAVSAEQLVKHALHPAPEVRLAAIETLGLLGATGDLIRPLISALADVDHRVQTASVKALGAAKARPALPQLIAMAEMTMRDEFRRDILAAIKQIVLE